MHIFIFYILIFMKIEAKCANSEDVKVGQVNIVDTRCP